MPTFIALYYNYTIKIPQNQHQIGFFVRNDFGKKQQNPKSSKKSAAFGLEICMKFFIHSKRTAGPIPCGSFKDFYLKCTIFLFAFCHDKVYGSSRNHKRKDSNNNGKHNVRAVLFSLHNKDHLGTG